MSDVISLLRDLVAIDSVNPSLVPGGAGEEAIADYIARWLRRERRFRNGGGFRLLKKRLCCTESPRGSVANNESLPRL